MPMSTTVTTTRTDSLAQQGYRAIRRAIRDGRIPRGQFFSETKLATLLGTSRTPVREALLTLFQDGVVDILPKRGYRLAELDEADIVEIRLIRVALERLVVETLCRRATRDDIAELRAILATGARGRKREADDVFSIDETFHMRMVELSGLRHIQRILLGVRGKMYLIASGTQVPPVRTATVAREHAAIVDALERRDSDAAVRAMSEHVESSIDAFVAARAHRVRDWSELAESIER